MLSEAATEGGGRAVGPAPVGVPRSGSPYPARDMQGRTGGCTKRVLGVSFPCAPVGAVSLQCGEAASISQ